ncbi:MAG: hypothetical protein M1832_005453 [Thelocarpon impressellum]|nr:MAG: hypothetical protein M1832_005453 [Thelocarpon impressellum]
MAGQKNGALGATFTVVRALQIVSLIAIIGMTANFIAEMVSSNRAPPNVLVGTLSVTCIAVLYCAITYILYLDAILPFLINLGTDAMCLIAVVVVAVTVGKPLSYMNCMTIGKATGNVDSAYDFAAGMGKNLNRDSGKVNYYGWAGANKATCLEMKSIWGLSIALCILFTFSMMCSLCLWRRSKAAPPKQTGV